MDAGARPGVQETEPAIGRATGSEALTRLFSHPDIAGLKESRQMCRLSVPFCGTEGGNGPLVGTYTRRPGRLAREALCWIQV